ncbi:class I SAM-dependent methyltransferase [Gracilibacillus alcaliphilus]|uniref:class I SAM-dependent methyltransferase n=1 Tax=Gracilibacillus alcaliphilus TaxID=1401441 RepID=UPI001957C3B4|nr:class I SAM-dependent methyltransferase [Gracilibacillus alcaliphilus]MBM7679321.1 SAM-dependent methyltransferase [Gracilibacillus alcaliphilus]
MFTNYGSLSTEVYNYTKPVGYSIGGDIEYYLDRLEGVKGKILEPGVGTGRFLIPLLEQELQVEGFDLSPDMLAACKQHCQQRELNPHLFLADMTNFYSEQSYQAIIIPTGSFGLIDTVDGARAALQNFYRHLEPGGRIILDLELPVYWETGKVTTSTFQVSKQDSIVLASKAVEINWAEQYTLSYLTYTKWRDGKLIDTEWQKFKLRWHGIGEFKLLLETVGFSNISVSAGYQFGQSPSATTEVITFEAAK